MNTWQNTLKRALRTFVQAALGYLVVAVSGGIDGLFDAEGKISKVAAGGLVVSSVAAGLAALMNLPDHGGKVEGVEMIEGAAIVKRINETEDDIPMAGQDEPEEAEDE